MMPRTKLEQLQSDQVAWVKYNFPNRPLHHPLLGIIEEFGELDEATEDLPHELDIKDAIADIMIFMADYCTMMSLNLQEIYDEAAKLMSDEGRETYASTIWLGKLAQAYLKSEQKIRGTPAWWRGVTHEALKRLIVDLCERAKLYKFDVVETTWHIWETDVSKRDWAKHRRENNLGEM